MKAAVLHGPGTTLAIEEIQLETPRRGEVLVKIAASGVCFSDWHMITGATPHHLPAIPEHEGAGIIQKVGEEVKRVRHAQPEKRRP